MCYYNVLKNKETQTLFDTVSPAFTIYCIHAKEVGHNFKIRDFKAV